RFVTCRLDGHMFWTHNHNDDRSDQRNKINDREKQPADAVMSPESKHQEPSAEQCAQRDRKNYQQSFRTRTPATMKNLKYRPKEKASKIKEQSQNDERPIHKDRAVPGRPERSPAQA